MTNKEVVDIIKCLPDNFEVVVKDPNDGSMARISRIDIGVVGIPGIPQSEMKLIELVVDY